MDLTTYYDKFILEASWDAGGEIGVEPSGDGFRVFSTGPVGDAFLDAHLSAGPRYDPAAIGIQAAALHRFMRQGPVIIRPKVDLCEALRDSEIRVPVVEYKIPFDVIGVDLPREIVGEFHPCLFLIWKFCDVGLAVLVEDRKNHILYHMKYGMDMPSIEERLVIAEGADTDAEKDLLVTGSRIALNLGMMASQRKTMTTPLPPKVERHRRQRDDRLNRLAARHVREMVFRDLVLTERPRLTGESRGEDHGKMPPQVRRAHWRRVCVGPKGSLRKWKWISQYYTGDPDERGDLPTVILK